MLMPKTFVVIPTFNEAENLAKITAAIFDLKINDLEILIVDDASPDGTGRIADQLVSQYSGRFHVMHRTGKLGLGTAYVQGFTWAMQQGAQYIIQMDADFSHSPGYLTQMIELIPEYDVVVGSRYIKGGKLDERWGWHRHLLSWWANSVWVRMILGTKTRDATAGFKCWQADALNGIGLENICSTGYIFAVEMCYLSEKKGYRIKEIPIYFEDRQIGESKMDTGIKIEAAFRVFDIRMRYRNIQPNNAHVQE
jgi:dolichol-phosphate mannosyltransferase